MYTACNCQSPNMYNIMAGTKGFNFAPSASALLLGFVGKGCYVANLSSVVHALTSGGQAGEAPFTVSHSTPSQPL